ncbi:MAG: hypothetical protein AAFR88_11880, partial [Pseudomonadota bacterium]
MQFAGEFGVQGLSKDFRFFDWIGLSAGLRISSSGFAMAACLGANPALAQAGPDPIDPPDEAANIEVEVVAVEGESFEGDVFFDFLPVVVGGFGDLLFLNRGFTSDQFVTFDGSLDLIDAPSASFQQNLSLPTYSIDSNGQGFALATTQGIATGFVGEAGPAEVLSISDAFVAGEITDTGNLNDGARPIILDDTIGLLLSDVTLADVNGDPSAMTDSFVLAASFLGELEQPAQFVINDSFSPTSLNFAGPDAFLVSTSPLFTSPNSAQTSDLLRLDISNGFDALAMRVGPEGNPQLRDGGGFAGGDLTFDGFTFDGNAFDGVTTFGGGANFDAREFSANSQSTVFLLNNALIGIDGGTDPSVPGQLLALDDQVILATSQNLRTPTQTSLGTVDFQRIEDVILAENGVIYFTSTVTDLDGNPLAQEVGIWRITDPGTPQQAISPLLQVGDQLQIGQEDLDSLFFQGAIDDVANIAGFDTAQIGFTAPIQTDGRPQFISINSDGNVATVVQIEADGGPRDAIIAQDDAGNWTVV